MAGLAAPIEFDAAKHLKVPGAFEVLGESDQLLHIQMAPGATVAASPGSMIMMAPGVEAKVDCSSCCARLLSGESCNLVTYTNTTDADAFLDLTNGAPSKVIPLALSRDGASFNATSGAFFAMLGPAPEIGYTVDCNPLTCLGTRQGCLRQSLRGDGIAFVQGVGTITTKTLSEGEQLTLDGSALLAWEGSTTLGVRPSGSCAFCCLGGEGCCYTTVTGPGTVYMQSMHWLKMKQALAVVVQERQGVGRTAMAASSML